MTDINVPWMLKVLLLGAVALAALRYFVGPGRLRELFTDKNGRVSPTKSGTVVAGMTFTLKMLGLLPASPDDPLLWLVFMGTVGGIEVAKKWLSMRYEAQTGKPAPGGAG